jgi:hypothetical protein
VKGGVRFGTCHAAGGVDEGRGGPVQRSNDVGWPAPAWSWHARAGGAP